MYVKDKSEGIGVPGITLAARIQGMRKSQGLNQADFGKKYGVSQVAVSRWEKGTDRPSTLVLLKLAEETGDADLKEELRQGAGVWVDIKRSAEVRENPIRFVSLLRDPVAAGTPRATDEREVQALLPFPKTLFPPGGELFALKVVGDSMTPSVPDGYTVIVDTAQRDPKKLVQRMVAAREGDGVTIKWLRKDGDVYMLVPQHTSVNHPVRIMRTDGDFSIVGRVIYIMGEPPEIRK